jgi:hypothetical protein
VLLRSGAWGKVVGASLLVGHLSPTFFFGATVRAPGAHGSPRLDLVAARWYVGGGGRSLAVEAAASVVRRRWWRLV